MEKKFLAYLKVAVAAVGPAPRSAAAVESAAFPVVETGEERHLSEFSEQEFIQCPLVASCSIGFELLPRSHAKHPE